MSADVDFEAARVMAEIIEPPLPPRDGQHPSITLAQSAVYNLARAYLTLAAVSRPAEARGEPEYAEVSDEQIIAHLDSLAALRMDSIGADAWHLAFKRAAYAMRQLRTHPAPSGGEAYSKRVVRDEPGVTEIHVEARQVLRDGPMRVECWWSDEDGAYIARLTDEDERGRPFAATHTGIGATREEALAHLAVAEYVTALAVAAPRPETGEVTDEQLCDLYRAHWQTRVDNAELIKAEAMLFAFVRAALAAREGA